MDFQLPEEHQMVRNMARDFAEKELMPLATRHDREEHIDRSVFDKMAELGLWGLTIPEEYGGAGLDNQALTAVLIEINRACASTGVTLSVHNSLIGAPLTKHGTPEQKQTWLPKLATGEILGSYCLTEANAGSDAAAVQTQAVRDGDDFVLNGTKLWVTNGALAGVYIVYCRTNTEVSKAKGVTAFLVPRDTPGLSVGKHEMKAGIRGSSTTEIVLDNVRIPATNMLGALDRGFPLALETLDGGRIGIAAQSIGIGRACLEAAIKYAGEREQFGQPIGNFQAIQWKIADMSCRLDAAELLTYKAAWLRDQGLPCTREAASAKLMASTAANFSADECLQIHGGAGYTDDFHVERLFRDARITEIYEGASDIQRLVIARQLLA
ncbi:Acyl-CoA dehydrogenase [Planctomycetes bacterium Pla163]|uniref:Cyclohex-1-ene-1-carbonyl-CoA dehydrogenase n=1 Tax=Rohdeia mirabilis TaxID=2528008 RepID=A0A518CYC9_9BACT|nr:Acyl-CoA dehydrogenase [Planctomycetes bacterium Pla163]